MDTSFQSLHQLANHISKNIELLNSGQLNKDQIEKLTESSRELYERMVVIRHKVYEKFGESESSAEPNIETPEVSETVVTEEPTITSNNPEPEIIEEMMSFDFSEPEASIETIEEVVEEKQDIIEVVKETTIEETITITEEIRTSLNESIKSETSSLNDVFKTSESNSIGDRLNQSAISDLKAHIDINKKFKFINELFKGDNENYNNAINDLNNCIDADTARNKLSDLSNTNKWDVESDAVNVFVQLIERRYL